MAAKHENRKKHLYYLHELSNYKIASDDPDVRGWQVKDADNRVIGTVDNLLVNEDTQRVVYLDVEVDDTIIEADHDPYGRPADSEVHEFINEDGENHIIIPVGLVDLNEDQNFVYTDRINYQTFAETKRIQKGSPVSRDYEVIVLDSYDRRHRSDERDYQDDRDLQEDNINRNSRVSDPESDDPTRRRRSDRDVEPGRDSGRIPGDDSFYERREFDRTNYRRKR